MSSHDFDFGCDFQSRVTGISAFMPPDPRFPLENKGQGAFLRRRLSHDFDFVGIFQSCATSVLAFIPSNSYFSLVFNGK